MRKKNNHKGNFTFHPYTLVEMLVVMAIIAILIGVGAGGYKVGRRWLAKSQTEAILAKLKIAIESYKNDKGYYPQPHTDPSRVPPVTGTLVISTADAPNFKLDTNIKDFADVDPTGYSSSLPSPSDHLQPRNNMNNFVDYSKIKQDQSLKVPNSKYNEYFVKDGWNSPAVGESYGAIKYRSPGLINKTTFDLYSVAFA